METEHTQLMNAGAALREIRCKHCKEKMYLIGKSRRRVCDKCKRQQMKLNNYSHKL